MGMEKWRRETAVKHSVRFKVTSYIQPAWKQKKVGNKLPSFWLTCGLYCLGVNNQKQSLIFIAKILLF